MSRISPGMMTVALIALLMGLGGAYVVRHHLTQPQAQQAPMPKPAAPVITVPVALTELEEGRRLVLDDIAIRRFPSQEAYKKSEYASKAYLPVPTQIAGRTLKRALKKGEVFTPDDLYASGDGPGIESRLQAGYRAVTVPVQDIGAVQGFARPGSFVDVLFRASPEGDRPEVTLTLFERIQVLAINSNVLTTQQVRGGTGSVTMAVTPHQAKVLKVVEGRGEISLTLRNPEDDFQFMPFDPGMQRGVSKLDGPEIFPASFPANARTATSKRNAADADIDADRIGGIDRVIGNASERVTMSDLLGLSPESSKKKMDIYLGPQKTTQEFNETSSESLEKLRGGSRISTPIVERPARRRMPLGTAQASPQAPVEDN